MQQPRFDERKFEQLILYLGMKCDDDPYFGATKLNKLLFYCDFAAYRSLGVPITGAEYQALPLGPAPTKLLPVRDRMAREGAIAMRAWGNQHRVIALREPDLSVFSASEISIVDRVIEELAGLNAEAVSELSHGFLGWRAGMAESLATGRQVVIPYATAFVSNEPVDAFEEAHIQELAKQHEWQL